MCIGLLPFVGEGVPKGRMRGGFSLTIPSPAGGRGPGRGWARFTSPPMGAAGRRTPGTWGGRAADARPGAGGFFFSFNLCPLCVRHTVPLFSSRSRPMNGTVSRTRPGPSALAGPRCPRSNRRPPRKPAPFFDARRNQTPPQKKSPSHFGPGEEAGTLVESLDGKEWGPLLFWWMKTTVCQATHGGGLRAC